MRFLCPLHVMLSSIVGAVSLFLVFLPTISDRNAFCLLNVMFSVYFHLWQKKPSGDKSLVGDVSFSFCNFTLSSVLFSFFFLHFSFCKFCFQFFRKSCDGKNNLPRTRVI